MKEPRKPKAARHKALPQRAGASDTAEHVSASKARVPQSARIGENQKGELTMTAEGSKRLARAFLGTNAAHDPIPKDGTMLDNARFAQLVLALPHAKGKTDSPEVLNFALDSMEALAPRDGMEVMLCSQLVALHAHSMDYMKRAMLPEQTVDGVDRNVNRAAKLLRAYATMADCLRTYRGGGQQKVTVEHVTVQAGGQAIVGTVNRGRGEGDDQQNGE